MWKFLLSFLLLSSSFSWGNEKLRAFVESLSKDQKILLEKFFQFIVRDSFSGYVLYGDKPICIEGYSLDTESGALSGVNEDADLFVKAVEFWKDLKISPNNKEYFFLIFNVEYGYCHIICINRRAFLRAVNENLSLFRYVLGPNLTADALLQQLIDSKERFYQVLKDDNVLLGILLGYGTENALLVSRKEYISDAFYYNHKEDFPFIAKLKRLAWEKQPRQEQKLPSFGFTTLTEELQTFKNQTKVSRSLMRFDSCHIPYFGCVPGSQETKGLLATYEKNRQEIMNAVQKETFLEDTLAKFFTTTSKTVDIPLIPVMQPLFISKNKVDFVQKLVHVIKNEIRSESYFQKSFLSAFLNGMEAKANGESILEISNDIRYTVPLLKKEIKQCENLKESDDFFSSLVDREDLTFLIPNKLCYKIISQGKGLSVSRKTNSISFHYSFRILNKKKSSYGTIKEEDPRHFIPGLTEALMGMKKGEKRKIYIHPEYGYGEETYFPPNATIIANIHLLDFKEGNEELIITPSHNLIRKNLSELLKKYEKLRGDELFLNGTYFWDMIKNESSLFDLQTFQKEFSQDSQDTNPFENETDRSRFIIDLGWSVLSKRSLF